MRIKVVVAVALLILLLDQNAGRAETAGDLLGSCEAILKDVQNHPDGTVTFPRSGDHCWYYLSAIQDGSVLTMNSKRMLGICSPPESSLLQFVRVFVNYGRANPATLHHQAFATVAYALGQAFPCKGQSH